MTRARSIVVLLALLAIPPGCWIAAAGSVRAGVDALRQAVERRAVDEAVARVIAPDRFTILSYRFVGADPAPEGRLALETLEVHGPNRSGFVRLRFRMLVDGRPCGEAHAVVRGRIRGPALVATRTLTHGKPLGPQDVKVVNEDLTRLRERPLRAWADVAGRVPVRTLGAGRPLTAALLEPAPLVRRGEPVEMRIEREALTVTVHGTALADGAPGDTVRAVNDATGAELLGQVQPDGTLLVVRGSVHGRKR